MRRPTRRSMRRARSSTPRRAGCGRAHHGRRHADAPAAAAAAFGTHGDKAAEHGAAREAAEIAALLVERGLGGNDTSLESAREFPSRPGPPRGRHAPHGGRLGRHGAARPLGAKAETTEVIPPLCLLALAYPDRIAKARGAPGAVPARQRARRASGCDRTRWRARPIVAIAEMQGKAAATRILLAAAATRQTSAAAGGAHHRADEVSSIRSARA